MGCPGNITSCTFCDTSVSISNLSLEDIYFYVVLHDLSASITPSISVIIRICLCSGNGNNFLKSFI